MCWLETSWEEYAHFAVQEELENMRSSVYIFWRSAFSCFFIRGGSLNDSLRLLFASAMPYGGTARDSSINILPDKEINWQDLHWHPSVAKMSRVVAIPRHVYSEDAVLYAHTKELFSIFLAHTEARRFSSTFHEFRIYALQRGYRL